MLIAVIACGAFFAALYALVQGDIGLTMSAAQLFVTAGFALQLYRGEIKF